MQLTPVLSSILLVVLAAQGGANWPHVQPLSIRIPVDFTAEKIIIDVPLRDQAGTVLYHFACRGGSETYLDSLAGT